MSGLQAVQGIGSMLAAQTRRRHQRSVNPPTSAKASAIMANMAHSSSRQSRFTVRKSTLICILFVIYLIGAHLRLSIYAGASILVPMYLMLFPAAIVTLLFINDLLERAGATFGLLVVFALAQPVLTTAPGSSYGNTLLGIMQLLVSIISALAFIYALSKVDHGRVRRIVLTIWWIVILLAALEVLALKPVFDQLRDALYAGSGRGIYSADFRDVAIYGRVRPTVFASEPSFLADTLSVLTLMVFFLDRNRGSLRSWSIMGAMVMVSFYLAPSFKILFFLTAALVWQFWPRNFKGLLNLLWGLGVAALLLALFFTQIFAFFVNFTGGHLESGSFFGRIGVAHKVGLSALETFPLFGYGIGNDGGLYPIIANEWNASGAFYLFPWYQDLPATDLMSNGFWWQVSYLGILGTLGFAALVLRLLREIGVASPLCTLICGWILWYAGAAFVDPHSWSLLMIFGIGAVQARSDVSQADPSPDAGLPVQSAT